MWTFNDYSYFFLHRTPCNCILTALPRNTTAALSHLSTPTSRNPQAVINGNTALLGAIRYLCSPQINLMSSLNKSPYWGEKPKQKPVPFMVLQEETGPSNTVILTYRNKSNYWACCMPSVTQLSSPSPKFCSSACPIKYMGWIFSANSHSTALKVGFLSIWFKSHLVNPILRKLGSGDLQRFMK